MPDVGGILNIVNFLLQQFFGKNVPHWVMTLVNWVLLVIVLLFALRALLVIVGNIQEVWAQKFLPLFYNEEQRRRLRRRQIFAKHIEYEIGRIDLAEDWKDEHFAELEAEVEAEGRHKHFSLLPFSLFSMLGNEVRREKSLSKALRTSQEQFIILEGEPGSGKSVALRHVAHQIAVRARKSHSINSVIPLYINLKGLERAADEPIDRNLIEAFVQKSLRRINDRDVDTFLDDEFAHGKANGTWFFLFDSFDEIPEVLSSTDADAIIKSYNDAIADFLQGGVNLCRGVIASRQFRGPKNSPWPHFRIVALSESRRLELIQRADLPLALEKQLIGLLGVASLEIRSMSSNPLFLSLLCEYIKSGHPFPENAHIVFETYIEHRLQRDSERVKQRFNLDVQQVRSVAEDIAFCMNHDDSLGLSATHAKMRAAMVRQGLNVDADFNKFLDALEFIKLARSESVNEIGDARLFTFSHRRFQEYFATCVVLRDPTRVTAKKILTDGRWRETAVVMCQTQPTQALAPLIRYAEKILMRFCLQVPNLIDDPLAYISNKEKDTDAKKSKQIEPFPWPDAALNILSILQEGFCSRLRDLSDDIRTYVGKLVLSATETGMLDDRKWALEVCGVAPEPVVIYMLKSAFAEDSQWLKEVAYRQVIRVSEIPEEIIQGMRDSLLNLILDNRLYRDRFIVKAHLARLPKPISTQLISTTDLLLGFTLVDIQWHFLFSLYEIIYYSIVLQYHHPYRYILTVIVALASSYFLTYIARLNINLAVGERLIFCIRSFLYAGLAVIGWTDYKHWIFNLILIILCANIVLMPKAYIISAKEYFLSRWYYAAYIPFWSITLTAYLFVKGLFNIKRKNLVKSCREEIIAFFAGCGLLFIISCVYSSFTLLLQVIKGDITLDIHKRPIFFILFILAIILLVFACLVLLAIIYFIVSYMLKFLYETMKWIKISQKIINTGNYMIYNEFCVFSDLWCFSVFLLSFARNVRRRQLLIVSIETEKSLKKLVLEMEISLQLKKQRDGQSAFSEMRKNINVQLFALARASECRSLVHHVNDDILDEIYLLLEDVKSNIL